MKFEYARFLMVFLIVFLAGCDAFEPEVSTPYATFITTVAGNGYDIAFDLIEQDDAYVLAGATGPQCDIIDAYVAQVDKENGGILNLRTLGESNQGVEENFFSLALIQGRFSGVGFSTRRNPPDSPNATFCTEPDDDGKLFLASLDEDFNELGSQYLEGDATKWDAGFDIQSDADGNFLIAGAWSDNIAFLQINGANVNVIRSEKEKGNGNDLLQHSSGRLFMSGAFKDEMGNPDFSNIYWAEVDVNNNRFKNERRFYPPDKAKDSISAVEAIVETADGNLLLGGYFLKNYVETPRTIFIFKTDLEGNQLYFKIVPIGINDSLHDMIPFEDGFVIVGSSRQEESTTRSDALIAKIDENGTVLWRELHDLRGNSEEAWTVIRTSDGGFLLGGQTYNQNNGIRTTLLIKTDAEGKVE